MNPPAQRTARDARGREVSLYDPMTDWLAGRDQPIPRDTLDAIIREAAGKSALDRRRLLWAAAAFLLILILAGAGVGASIVREGPAAWRDLLASLAITGPALLAMLAAGVWLPLALAKRARRAHLRHAMLGHARCPHCAYDLAAVPTQPDARPRVICPECGCEWPAPTPAAPQAAP